MWQTLRQQSLALVSVLIALSALGYNTWRNELTERNRNIRQAGFEILRELAELQLVIDYALYDQDVQRGNPITGWGRVGLIGDLSAAMPPAVGERAAALREICQAQWRTVQQHEESNRRVTEAIAGTRATVLAALASLR